VSIPKRNFDGSYSVLATVLGETSSNGVQYQKSDILEHLSPSSMFMKRLHHGGIPSELGIPGRYPGQSVDDYWQRCWEISPENICCLIIHATIDHSKRVVGELGLVLTIKPYGQKGPALSKLIANQVPLKFGVRGFTSAKGNVSPKLTTLVTFDVVPDESFHARVRVA
jgi:hypothetical protein